MKKYKELVVLTCVALLALGLVAPAVAGQGAVKADLMDVATGMVDLGDVIITPTADGKFEVTVHVRDSSITAKTNLTAWAMADLGWAASTPYPAAFHVNKQGKGSAHISVPTNIASGNTVMVKVSVWDETGAIVHYSTVSVLMTVK